MKSEKQHSYHSKLSWGGQPTIASLIQGVETFAENEKINFHWGLLRPASYVYKKNDRFIIPTQ